MTEKRERTVSLISYFLIAFIFAVPLPIYAQNKERLLNNDAVVARDPLPSKVYQAQKNVLQIIVRFYVKTRPDFPPRIYYGSGFVEKNSGLVITAGHLLIDPLSQYDGHPYIDDNGLPKGAIYDYKFYAAIYTATGINEYPLTLVDISPFGTYADIMRLKPIRPLPVNPLTLAFNPAAGDDVYISGFTLNSTSYLDKNSRSVSLVFDRIKYNIKSKIGSVIESKELLSAGVIRKYRFLDSVPHGFSGCPVLNKNGEVIAMMTETYGIFSYALSSQDIDKFRQ